MDANNSLNHYLFARPSFLEGLARTLDISGSFDVYPAHGSRLQDDAQAIRSDWKMVGRDIQFVIDEYHDGI